MDSRIGDSRNRLEKNASRASDELAFSKSVHFYRVFQHTASLILSQLREQDERLVDQLLKLLLGEAPPASACLSISCFC